MSDFVNDDPSRFAPRRPGPLQIVFVLLRNSVPIAGLWYYGWSTAQFLLLTQFGFATGMATLGVAGMTAQELRAGKKSRWEIWNNAGVAWISATLLLALLGCFWLFFVGQFGEALTAPGTLAAAMAIVLSAVPTFVAEMRFNLTSPLSDYERQTRARSLINPLFAGMLISFLLGNVLVGLAGKKASPGILHGMPNVIVIIQLVVIVLFGFVRELWPEWIHIQLRKLWKEGS